MGSARIMIAGGDFRLAKPYVTNNIGSRRLGCGGRALLAMGESDVSA